MNEHKGKEVLVKGLLVDYHPYFHRCLVKIGDETFMIEENDVEPYIELEKSYDAIKRIVNNNHNKPLTSNDLLYIFGKTDKDEILSENEPVDLVKKLKDWDEKMGMLESIRVGDIVIENETNIEVCVTMKINGRKFHGFEIQSGLPRMDNDLLKYTKTGKNMIIRSEN